MFMGTMFSVFIIACQYDYNILKKTVNDVARQLVMHDLLLV
jgi:hypothetical protein